MSPIAQTAINYGDAPLHEVQGTQRVGIQSGFPVRQKPANIYRFSGATPLTSRLHSSLLVNCLPSHPKRVGSSPAERARRATLFLFPVRRALFFVRERPLRTPFLEGYRFCY